MKTGASIPAALRADAGSALPGLPAAPDKAKRRATLAAKLALRGFALHDTQEGTYIVSRWGMSREKCCLDGVEDFARQVGAAK
jgi:hypothetical protein